MMMEELFYTKDVQKARIDEKEDKKKENAVSRKKTL